MRRRQIRSKMALQFLLTHLLVLILPTATFVFLTSVPFLGHVRDTAFRSASRDLQNTAQYLDMQIGQMNEIALSLSLNHHLSPGNLTKSSTAYFEIYRAMRPYVNTGTFADEMFFYRKRGDLLYSDTYAYNFDIYFKQIRGMESPSAETFRAGLDELSAPAWFPLDESTVCYAMPIFGFSNGQNVMVCLFAPATLEQFLGGAVEEGVYTAMYAENRLLCASSFEEGLHEAALFEPLTDQDVKSLRMGDKEVYALRVKAIKSDLTLVRAIAPGVVLRDVRSMQTLLTLGVFGIALVGSMAAVTLSRRNYRPIRELADKARVFLDKRSQGLNEIEAAGLALVNLSDSFERSQRERAALILLFGKDGDPEHLKGEYRKAGIEPTANPHRIALFQPLAEGIARSERDVDSITEALAGVAQGVHVFGYTESSGYLLWLCGETVKPSALRSRLNAASQSLSGAYAVGVGSAYPDIPGAQMSFRESRLSANALHAARKAGVAFYKDHQVREKAYPRSELNLFSEAIRAGDLEQFDMAGGELLRMLEDPDISFGTRVGYEMACIVNLTLSERKVREGDARARFIEALVTRELSGEGSILHAARAVCEDARSAIVSIRAERSAQNPMERVRQYVDANYRDPNLSAKAIGAEFGLSVSNLSHQFKRHTGFTLSEFVDELRLRMAKQLLTETDYTVKRIAEEVGFAHPVSFTRKFKQKIQCTPAEFRENINGT